MNDVDLEMMELAEIATELEDSTCQRCGAVDMFTTVQHATRADRTERYQCICSHITVWVNGRRQS